MPKFSPKFGLVLILHSICLKGSSKDFGLKDFQQDRAKTLQREKAFEYLKARTIQVRLISFFLERHIYSIHQPVPNTKLQWVAP